MPELDLSTGACKLLFVIHLSSNKNLLSESRTILIIIVDQEKQYSSEIIEMSTYREIKYGLMGYYKKTITDLSLEKIDSLISDYQETLRKNHVISSEAKPVKRILVYYHESNDKIIVDSEAQLARLLKSSYAEFAFVVLVSDFDEKTIRELNAKFMNSASTDHKYFIFKTGRADQRF